jgi:hypothetical protein
MGEGAAQAVGSLKSARLITNGQALNLDFSVSQQPAAIETVTPQSSGSAKPFGASASSD